MHIYLDLYTFIRIYAHLFGCIHIYMHLYILYVFIHIYAHLYSLYHNYRFCRAKECFYMVLAYDLEVLELLIKSYHPNT